MEKWKKNPSLMGAKFDIICTTFFLVGVKRKEHLAIIILIKK
jgi:hypothetical protein